MKNLPNTMIRFKSSDKEHHQKPDYKDLGNCCSPVFAMITNNVNCGKSSLCKNLLIRKSPCYERIVIFSPLGDESTEYSDDIDCEIIQEIPEFDFF